MGFHDGGLGFPHRYTFVHALVAHRKHLYTGHNQCRSHGARAQYGDKPHGKFCTKCRSGEGMLSRNASLLECIRGILIYCCSPVGGELLTRKSPRNKHHVTNTLPKAKQIQAHPTTNLRLITFGLVHTQQECIIRSRMQLCTVI